MRAPLALAGLTLLLAGLSLETPAAAAAPMCQGEEATIVGAGTLNGTSGPDVILATGEATIWGNGGDDTICSLQGEVHAGDGDDAVEGTATSPSLVEIDLGPGDDRFVDLGGSHDEVDGRSASGSPGHDVIVTGDGNDQVTSGAAGEVNQDEIDLGAGHDDANLLVGSGSAVEVVVGQEPAGQDALLIEAPASDTGLWDVDLASGSVKRSGVEIVSVSASVTQRLFVRLRLGADSQVHVSGGPRRESVDVWSGEVTQADLGAGSDYLRLALTPQSSGRLDGGQGHDAMVVLSNRIDLNLAKNRLRSLRSSGPGYKVSDFDVWGLSAPRIAIKGDKESNRFQIAGCRVRMSGGKGNDYLAPGRVTQLVEPITCESGARWQLYGQGGNDRLRAWEGDDVLIGGGGRDSVAGGSGIDKCRAERTQKSCDR